MAQSWKVSVSADTASKATREAAARGLEKAAEHVLQVSNTKVPIDEGTLERSGRTSIDKDKLQGAISYDTPYAVEQHENLSIRHDSGRQAKFLENAATSEQQVIRDLIAAEIKNAIGL